MAGRGRGRGRATGSISTEQLGLAKGDTLPPPCLQPPPHYPPREYKAPPLPSDSTIAYRRELKRHAAETMLDSRFNARLDVIKKDIERYSERYAKTIEPAKVSWDQRYEWTMFFPELKPAVTKRKIKASKSNAKKAKICNVDEKLNELEQKETLSSDGEDGETKKKADGEDDDEVEDEAVEADEEMDEGTDYGNNYFDNGEGYDDEDDNLDDGPVF